MTDTENKTPKFLPSTRLGESGLRDNKLYVPFFLWGSNLENVLPNFEFNSFISKPRKMNFAFFTRLAKHINTKFRATGGLRMDWDWDSVKKNIIMPNIEHIKEVNNLNDKHIEMIKDDLFVALNNWTDNWDTMKILRRWRVKVIISLMEKISLIMIWSNLSIKYF